MQTIEIINETENPKGSVHAMPTLAGDIELQWITGTVIMTIPKRMRAAFAEFLINADIQ